jgi:hypothetical protein
VGSASLPETVATAVDEGGGFSLVTEAACRLVPFRGLLTGLLPLGPAPAVAGIAAAAASLRDATNALFISRLDSVSSSELESSSA